MKTAFSSGDALSEAIRALADELDQAGLGEAATDLRDGLACLNGLTDGWALLLESIERVRRGVGRQLDGQARERLAAIRADVRRAVYRR